MALVVTSIGIGLLVFLILFLKSLCSRNKNLPPGPRPLPIIGNLHLLGYQPHQSLCRLSKTYGPIMLLRLGYKNTVVISSAEIAKEVLQKQDLAFSSRAVYDAMHAHDHDKFSVALLPVGPQWRRLRKIMSNHMFARSCLDANQNLRRKKVEELVEYCRKSSESGEAVNLGRAAFRTTLSLMSNTIFSTDWGDLEKELKELLGNILSEVLKPNVMDFFPLHKTFDPQGIRRHTAGYMARFYELISEMIDERMEKKGGGSDESFIDIILTISKEKPEEIDRKHIVAMCFDMIAGGTETSSNTVEWAMAEMLQKPEKMKRVKDELDQVVGKRKILVEEDMNQLPYLQCIVKETFRLHPATPFLVPREVQQDVHLCGYTIPRKSQVFVNTWAIGRDADTWVDPLEFKPERFLDSDVDLRGAHFELIPFGAGRRICPAMALGMRMVTVMLGSLLNSFDWKIDGPKELNMEERFGITLQKAYPLLAIPTPL